MILCSYDENRHVMRLSGHAGFEEVGKDIVCAGVSFGYMMCMANGMIIEHEGDDIEITALGCNDIGMLNAYAFVIEQTAIMYPDNISFNKIIR